MPEQNHRKSNEMTKAHTANIALPYSADVVLLPLNRQCFKVDRKDIRHISNIDRFR